MSAIAAASPPSPAPLPGTEPLDLPGFTYLPRFMSAAEATAVGEYAASVTPIWEQRYAGDEHRRQGASGRGLNRPVYWLGGWQFACLGYYAEPDHLTDRTLRAEPIPAVMQNVLERLQPTLAGHGRADTLPNTGLVNYYGRQINDGPPRDLARLGMHRDLEPGPVVVMSVGQPALFEVGDPARGAVPEASLWLRNRSIAIFSGPVFKERLYHRVARVRYGKDPALTCRVQDFELRRLSISFRYVPQEHIHDLTTLSASARAKVLPYVETLAQSSQHFRDQLELMTDAE